MPAASLPCPILTLSPTCLTSLLLLAPDLKTKTALLRVGVVLSYNQTLSCASRYLFVQSTEVAGSRGRLRKCQTATLQQFATSIHSITWSARASSVGATVRPSALAILRLTTSWNLVGN